jgi:hypothetical protein
MSVTDKTKIKDTRAKTQEPRQKTQDKRFEKKLLFLIS